MRQPASDDRHAVGSVIPLAPSTSPWERSVRSTYQPTSWRTRLIGIGGVVAIALTVAGGALLTWTHYQAPKPAQALTVFDVAPPAAPIEPARDVEPRPEDQPQEQEQQQPKVEQPIAEPPVVRLPTPNMIAAMPVKPVQEASPPAPKTMPPPEAKPIPPAAQPSNAAPTWQGQVLAALNKVRRYPREARFHRQQGVPHIRFVMNREGKVLSSRLEHGSGVRLLDEEALALAKRAQPLPKPPEDVRGDTIELVVPVEFFLR